MKKRLTVTASSLVIISLLGILFFRQAVQSETDRLTNANVPENQTIRILSEKLKDASEEEIYAYFHTFSDDQKIIADPSGGFLTSLDGHYTVSERQDDTGQTIVQSFDDPKVAATIREVKDYLRNH